MPATPRECLQEELLQLERRVAAAWSGQEPPVPRHLHGYRAAWRRTLQAGLLPADARTLFAHAAEAGVLLVSDFHPLERSRRELARLLRALPPQPPPALLLELLPQGVTRSARAVLAGGDAALVHGPGLIAAYRPVLEALAERDGVVVGVWSDGSAAQRDARAAELWARLRRTAGRRARRWIFHFGDWHLAEPHLPARLRARGARPLVVHQSPAPLWHRLGARPAARAYRLDGTRGHWAWLNDHPLSLCAAVLAEPGATPGPWLAEATEHLVESLARELALLAGLPEPSARLTVEPPDGWDAFHAGLPADVAATHEPHRPPTMPLFHPGRPACWIQGAPTWNLLAQAAAHALLLDGGNAEPGLSGAWRRQAARHLCAALLNPFHRAPAPASLAARLYPAGDRRALLRALRGVVPRLHPGLELPPAAREFAAALWGAHSGVHLSARDELDAAFLGRILQSGGEALDWQALTATIRAA